ncbi:uncharacterized protein LOC132060477 [Lycium ferocissimum]|uniref:uncharacterized protein LOC132060477 n=1 Tax=Lycium ferocissimum TaxID=112874 RepID=UPI00281569C7|nr:uncharacterized protein LOC132060477 [Lycium ferocissimum]
MGGGNGQKAKMAREKNAEKIKDQKGSQLEANKKAMNIKCKFLFGILQQQLPIAGESAKIAERRSKKIHDPSRMRQLPPTEVPKRSKQKDDVTVKKGSKVAQQNKRKVTKPSSDVKGKNVVKDVDLEEDEQSHPEGAPSMQRYTNIEVFKDIKSKLTVPRHLEVQAQIFRCFMVRELKESTSDCFTIDINGTVLRFTMREFALMSGLNCVADEGEFTYDEEESNRIMDAYFGGTRKTSIPRVHFEVVEDGRYVDYPWGKEAFNELIRSISKKYSATTQYYRIHGMPLAMQVWLYECCSRVPSYLAIKSGNSIPRMLNWRSIDNRPKYNILMEGIFRDGKRSSCTFANTIPTSSELESLQLPDVVVCRDTVDKNVLVDANEGTQVTDMPLDDFDDFSTTPPHLSKGKQQQRTNQTDSPPSKRRRQLPTTASTSKKQQIHTEPQTTVKKSHKDQKVAQKPILQKSASPKLNEQMNRPQNTTVLRDVPTISMKEEIQLLRKDFQVFKESVIGEFTSELSKLRTFMDDNFKKLFEAIKVNNSVDKGVGPKLHEEVPEIVVTAENLRAIHVKLHLKRLIGRTKELSTQQR